jgi:hypothetical protein
MNESGHPTKMAYAKEEAETLIEKQPEAVGIHTLEDLYDEAFTSVNPSNVLYGHGSLFPEPFSVNWRNRIVNCIPVHYPDSTTIAGLPHYIHHVQGDMGNPQHTLKQTQEDATVGVRGVDPLTLAYGNMISNPNAVTLFKGGMQDNWW